jgi:hypothetical protein
MILLIKGQTHSLIIVLVNRIKYNKATDTPYFNILQLLEGRINNENYIKKNSNFIAIGIGRIRN